MKISTKAVSSYLSQTDVPAPILAEIDDVTIVDALRNKDVLHFADQRVKPLPLNLTNKRFLVGAFGDETDAWHGKAVEIYIDPSVTDSKGQVTGGIRLRIPTGPRHGGGNRPATVAAPAPKPAAPAPKRANTIEEKHAAVVAGYKNAKDESKVLEIDAWVEQRDWPPFMCEQQDLARNAALDRLGVGIGAGSLPF